MALQKRSEETKRKMSENNSGENNPMYGRTGESNPSSKLKWDKVSEIRELYKTGETSFRKLAKEYGVSKLTKVPSFKYTIESIIKYKTWKI